jgi:alpha-glucosidase
MAVGETWGVKESHLANYVRPDELNLTFNFELLEAKWGAATFRTAIDDSMSALRQVSAPCTWVLGNHDVDRPVRRYGGGDVGVRRARAAALVQFSLPGVVYLYNGDELGLDNVDLPDSALQDPTWERSGHTLRGRDGERVPLPWSGTRPPYGFSATDVDTWLPMPKGWADVTAEAEQRRDDSTYKLIRAAIGLRRTLRLGSGEFGWLARDTDILHYRCGPLTVLLNTGSAPVPLPAGKVLLSSGPIVDAVPPDTAVWVQG